MITNVVGPKLRGYATATALKLKSRVEAAEYLGVKPQTLAVWATTKRYNLPYVKVGSLVKYRQEDLDAFLEERTVGVSEN